MIASWSSTTSRASAALIWGISSAAAGGVSSAGTATIHSFLTNGESRFQNAPQQVALVGSRVYPQGRGGAGSGGALAVGGRPAGSIERRWMMSSDTTLGSPSASTTEPGGDGACL